MSDRPEDFTVYDKDGFAIPLFAKDFDPSPEMFPLFICGRAAVGAAMAERALVTHSDLQMQGLEEPSQEAPLGRAREMQHDAAAIQEKFEVHEKLGPDLRPKHWMGHLLPSCLGSFRALDLFVDASNQVKHLH